MTNQIYTATGCARCKITKRFMQENDIEFEEYDFKAEGKEAFSQFYRTNRASIYRDKDGVEFPIFTDGKVIRQGVSVVIGYLVAGDRLNGFIDRSTLHGEWIDGFDISGSDPEYAEQLMQVFVHLKNNGLKIQITSDGSNASVLKAIVEKGLADRVILHIKGPASLYTQLTGEAIDEDEIKQSIVLASRVPHYQYITTVAPVVREDGTVGYLTTEEIGRTAEMIEAATGSKKHPYELRAFDPQQTDDEQLKSITPLPASELFKYRTAARRYMVMAEIQK